MFFFILKTKMIDKSTKLEKVSSIFFILVLVQIESIVYQWFVRRMYVVLFIRLLSQTRTLMSLVVNEVFTSVSYDMPSMILYENGGNRLVWNYLVSDIWLYLDRHKCIVKSDISSTQL